MRFDLDSIKNQAYFFIVGSVPLLSTSVLAETPTFSLGEETLKAMEVCRQEKSPLERLDCYDNAWKTNMSSTSEQHKSGVAWNRAMEHENARANSTISLLTKSYNSDENNPTIIITTPALGYKSPRPVLMFSCIDNITRLQIALLNPSDKRDAEVEVSTDRNKFETRWFFRENGFLLEASRGLEGISEIQKLFKSNTLKIKSNIPAVNGLTFNIQNLEQEIKPLREACHW